MEISTLATCSLSSYCGNKLRIHTERKEKCWNLSLVVFVIISIYVAKKKCTEIGYLGKGHWSFPSHSRSLASFFSPFHITLHSSRVHSSVRSRSLFGVTTTTTCTHISRERAVGSRTRANTTFHFTQFPSRARPFSQISLLFHSPRRSNVHLVLISYPYRMACWEYTEALCTSADDNESEREKQQRIYVITHGTDEGEWEKPDLWAYFFHVRCLTMCPILLCSVSFRSLLSLFFLPLMIKIVLWMHITRLVRARLFLFWMWYCIYVVWIWTFFFFFFDCTAQHRREWLRDLFFMKQNNMNV